LLLEVAMSWKDDLDRELEDAERRLHDYDEGW